MSEILGTLFKYLAALLAIVAVVTIFYEALGNNNAGTAVSEITSLQSGVESLYSGNPSALTTANLTAASLIIAGAAPQQMQASSTTLVDPWGGAVTLGVPTAGSQFSETMANVPQAACVHLATTIYNEVSMTIDSGTAITAIPVSPTVAATDCSSASNTIAFTFGL
jgi:hypothetical protein